MNEHAVCPPTPPLPLLITGLAGVAGYNAFHYFRRRYGEQVIGVRQADNWPLQGEGIAACDAEDLAELRRLFDRHQFRSVLNCAGNCKLKGCELAPEIAERINIGGVRNLIEVLEGTSTRLVHLSIDLVFSGAGAGEYEETAAADPVTVYGRTVAEAEDLLLQRYPAACLLRISLPMGVSFNGHAGAIDWIQSRFRKGRPATLYYDEIRTPTYVDCLNEVCERMLAGPWHGLFHAGGPQRLSLYQIAQIVNRVGGYDPKLLMGCFRRQAGPIPPRAGNVSMNSGKLRRLLGVEPFQPWPADERLLPTHTGWHAEPGWRGSPEALEELLYGRGRLAARLQ